ncbi:hypothetical protein BH11ACT8_BH11ACT8_15300 [soil metagenome]
MTAYLILGVVGLVIISISLLVGDLFDGILDGLGADWFSTEVVGGFVSALGFGGAIAVSAGAPGAVAVVVGIVVGTVFAFGAAWLTRLVKGGGTDEAPRTSDVIGHEGVVVSEVPPTGFGTVEVRIGGHTLRFNASADLGLEAGTRVHVTEVLSPTAVSVSPVWSGLPPGSAHTADD